jgi:hypothetical protein
MHKIIYQNVYIGRLIDKLPQGHALVRLEDTGLEVKAKFLGRLLFKLKKISIGVKVNVAFDEYDTDLGIITSLIFENNPQQSTPGTTPGASHHKKFENNKTSKKSVRSSPKGKR